MDYKTLDDVSLIARIAHADEGALDELYQRYSRLVFSVALHSLGEATLAEEVTQEVFLRIWKKAETYRASHAKVYTWIVAITRNRAIDILRQARRRPQIDPLPWVDQDSLKMHASEDIELEIEDAIQHQRLRAALAKLPKAQREALAYAFFGGFSHQEIADLLAQPLGTVKTRIRLAMQRLKQALQFGDEGDEPSTRT